MRALLRSVRAGSADARWRGMGGRPGAEALGFVTQAVRRRWGIAAVRAQAECRLSRRQYVGAARGARRQEGAPAAELDAVAAVDGGHFGARYAEGGGGWAGEARQDRGG